MSCSIRRLCKNVLLALSICLLGVTPAVPEGPVRLLREGDWLYQQRQYSRSLDSYRAAEETGMLGAVPGSRIAKLRLALGRLSLAQQAVGDLERAGADEGTELVARGILAFRQQDYADARLYLDRALRVRPLDEEARYYLGRSHLLLGEYSAAVDEFSKILASPSPTPSRWRESSHYNLGLIHLIRGERAAVEHFQKAEEEKVDSELAQKALKLLSAAQSLGEAPKQQPDALASTGVALLSVGEVYLARGQFERAVDLRPDYTEATAYLGYLSWLKGEYSRADVLIERSIRLRAESPLGHYFLGVLRRSQERLREAVTEFERVIAIDPKSAPAYVELGRTLILERDYAGAASALERAVEIAPDNVGYHLQLAHFYLDHALRLGRALVVARRAAQLAPDDAEALDALGWALWANGQTYDARHNLELAIAANPDLAIAHFHMASLLATEWDADAAAQEFRRAMELERDNAYSAKIEAALHTLELR